MLILSLLSMSDGEYIAPAMDRNSEIDTICTIDPRSISFNKNLAAGPEVHDILINPSNKATQISDKRSFSEGKMDRSLVQSF